MGNPNDNEDFDFFAEEEEIISKPPVQRPPQQAPRQGQGLNNSLRQNPANPQRIPNNVNPANRIPTQRPAGNTGIPKQRPENAVPENRIPRQGIPTQRPQTPQQRPQRSTQQQPGQGQQRINPQTANPAQNQQPSRNNITPPVQNIPREPVVNQYDAPDDDTFQSMSNDQQIIQNNIEFESEYSFDNFDEPAPPMEFNFEEPAQEGFFEEELSKKRDQGKEVLKNRLAEEERALNIDNSGQNSFVDPNKNALEPFGGKKQKKIKEENFDDRVNLRKKAVIVRSIVIGLAVIFVGLGFKNAIFPPDSLTVDEVAIIAKNSTGITSFPIEGGKGYVRDFMTAYLTVDRTNEDSAKMMNYFYNGDMNIDAGDINRTATGKFGQRIVSGPTIYEATALSDYSANYTVATVVKPYSTNEQGDLEEEDVSIEYFSVNVYYDSKTDTYSIPKDSPTLIPEISFTNPSLGVPVPAKFGTGEKDNKVTEEIAPLVTEFMKAYSISSLDDYDSLKQYIKSNDEINLENGLAGKYIFENDDPSRAIEYTAFAQDPEKISNEYKVEVKVRWQKNIGSSERQENIIYSSSYVMTIERQANNQFLVTKFAPFYFVRDEKAFTEFDSKREVKPVATKEKTTTETE